MQQNMPAQLAMMIIAMAEPDPRAGRTDVRKFVESYALLVVVIVTLFVVEVVVVVVVVTLFVVVVVVVIVVVVGHAKVWAMPSPLNALAIHSTNLDGHSTFLNFTFPGLPTFHPQDAKSLQPGLYNTGNHSHLSIDNAI